MVNETILISMNKVELENYAIQQNNMVSYLNGICWRQKEIIEMFQKIHSRSEEIHDLVSRIDATRDIIDAESLIKKYEKEYEDESDDN